MGAAVFRCQRALSVKIKLIRGCIVPGHPHAQPGDTLEVSRDVGTDLLAIGKAVRVVEVETVQTREPEIENREPVAIKAAKRSKSKLV